VSDRFDEWIDRVVRRADELRSKGVLAIGVDGCTATFAAAEPVPAAADDEADDKEPKWPEPSSPWEDPDAYPSGFVPTLEIDDLSKERR